MEKGTNKIYMHAKYRRLAWGWLQGGMSDREVKEGLVAKGFTVALRTVSAFRQIMEQIEEYGGASGDSTRGRKSKSYKDDSPPFDDIPEELRALQEEDRTILQLDSGVGKKRKSTRLYSDSTLEETMKEALGVDQMAMNDAVLLDSIITKGFKTLLDADAVIGPTLALRAIEIKRALLGKNYTGQTAWETERLKRKLSLLLDVVNRNVEQHTWDKIILELEECGWDKDTIATEDDSGNKKAGSSGNDAG